MTGRVREEPRAMVWGQPNKLRAVQPQAGETHSQPFLPTVLRRNSVSR
jgi:hypothetical protein